MIALNADALEPNWGGLLLSIGQIVVGRTKERVLASINPDNSAYKPLSPLTIKKRRNKSTGGTKPLIDTGNMLSSINAQNINIKLGELSVSVGVGAGYAIYHDSLKPRKKIPYRGILDHKQKDIEEQSMIDDVIDDFLDNLSHDVLERINV